MADNIDKNERFEQGMKTRRAVLGDAHVDRAQTVTTGFDQPFQQLITEAAWGTVWSGNHWTKRERSIVTIALLAALGQDEELAMHVRATANTGATEADIREALLHVAIYLRRSRRQPRFQDRQACSGKHESRYFRDEEETK